MQRTDVEKGTTAWLCKSSLVLCVRLSSKLFEVWVRRLKKPYMWADDLRELERKLHQQTGVREKAGGN